MIDKKAQGKANRAKGARFERKTRLFFESEGWVIDKFTNNIDLDKSCIVPAKSNMFGSRSCGFPDFLMFRKVKEGYEVMLVECKCNGTLSKIEKLKMEWLKDEGFECWVASPNGKSVELQRPSIIRRKDSRD